MSRVVPRRTRPTVSLLQCHLCWQYMWSAVWHFTGSARICFPFLYRLFAISSSIHTNKLITRHSMRLVKNTRQWRRPPSQQRSGSSAIRMPLARRATMLDSSTQSVNTLCSILSRADFISTFRVPLNGSCLTPMSIFTM